MDREQTKGERRKQQVLTLARRQLIELGIDKLTLRSLADELGMTLGNLQYYFPSRDDLLEAVLRAEVATDLSAFRTAIGTGIADTGASEAADELRNAVTSLAHRWYALNGSVYLPVAVRALHDDRSASVIREIWEQFYAEFTSLVRRVDPEAGRTEARCRAMLIVTLLDGSSIQSYATSGRLSRRAMAPELASAAVRIARGR